VVAVAIKTVQWSQADYRIFPDERDRDREREHEEGDIYKRMTEDSLASL
jgi:hypothetical protein